jgi:hypothetical protein
VEPDPDGAIAQAFGAYTSGQVLVYGADGGLLFNGGITASRGHEGDNPGRAAIVARLRDQVPAPSTASVFGCALDEPERGSPSPVRTLENSR